MKHCTYGRRFGLPFYRREVRDMELISILIHFRGFSFRFVIEKLKDRHSAK